MAMRVQRYWGKWVRQNGSKVEERIGKEMAKRLRWAQSIIGGAKVEERARKVMGTFLEGVGGIMAVNGAFLEWVRKIETIQKFLRN